jgi:hypothetical protein
LDLAGSDDSDFLDELLDERLAPILRRIYAFFAIEIPPDPYAGYPRRVSEQSISALPGDRTHACRPD